MPRVPVTGEEGQITVRPVWRYSLSGNTVGLVRPHLREEFLDACRFKLTVVLGRLTAGHLNQEGSGVDRIERVAEPPVCESTIELALYCSRYLAANRMNWSAFLVQQVSEALERIDNGSYGLCLRCGQSIEVNRLAVLPWVTLCIGCQEGKFEYSLTHSRTRNDCTL